MEQTPRPTQTPEPNGHQSLEGLSDLETLIALAKMGLVTMTVDCEGQMFFDLPGYKQVPGVAYIQREAANGKLPDDKPPVSNNSQGGIDVKQQP